MQILKNREIRLPYNETNTVPSYQETEKRSQTNWKNTKIETTGIARERPGTKLVRTKSKEKARDKIGLRKDQGIRKEKERSDNRNNVRKGNMDARAEKSVAVADSSVRVKPVFQVREQWQQSIVDKWRR